MKKKDDNIRTSGAERRDPSLLGMTGWRAESPHYIFVLPDGYSGSIQVIFDSRRAPGEKYQIDVPEDDPHPGMISPKR